MHSILTVEEKKQLADILLKLQEAGVLRWETKTDETGEPVASENKEGKATSFSPLLGILGIRSNVMPRTRKLFDAANITVWIGHDR